MQAIRKDPSFRECDLLPWSYPAGTFSNTNPQSVAVALANEIDRLNQMFHFDRVYFIGHSMGGVIVRAAYLEGENEDKLGSRTSSDWCCLRPPIAGLKSKVFEGSRYG